MTKTIIAIFALLILSPSVSYSGQIGSAAPAFNLMGVNGKGVSLEQFKGKVVFLAFWAPWCTPCREELPALEDLHKKFGKDGFQVIGVSVDDSLEDVEALLHKVPISFPILLDKGDVNESYRVTGLPTGFIVGRDGIIWHVHRGFGKEFIAIYEKEIQELLKRP
jgi:peroxiredoxin